MSFGNNIVEVQKKEETLGTRNKNVYFLKINISGPEA